MATNYEGVLYDDAPLVKAVESVLNAENCPEAEVDLILVDDEFLRELKFEYFNQDVYTDVISFRLNPESEDRAEGEIYISLDRAAEQALEYDVTADMEILRLAIHGTLHLLGYEDDTEEKKALMSSLENRRLEQFSAPTVIQSITEE